MKPKVLPFRQVHLDFHTSPLIPGIGEKFDKARWQDTLLGARVNSITLFSKCHHGWSYHPTRAGRRHPHLDFDLLRAQFEACQEVGIAVPLYLSSGVDNLAAAEHPEWREMNADGAFQGWVTSPLEPGFWTMDFFSPYLEHLCAQIEETVQLFPECDGIFLDISTQYPGCSKWRMEWMKARDIDATIPESRQLAADAALDRYFRATNRAAKILNPDMPVFHNAGHIRRGDRAVLEHFSHLELESLPTGGWGYDHFPMSAKYVVNLPMEFLGQTGKFHTTWGEFGGYKHPNALRYECSAMIAFNAKCSIGDQLHPGGALDDTTYRMIGAAYREVESKEPWCRSARPVSDIGVLSSEAENHSDRNCLVDEGVTRALLEGHFLFEFLDREMSFARYKLLILPDDIRVDETLKARLDDYLRQGGRLLFTGESGLWCDRAEFAFDLGAEYVGPSEYSPDFVLPREDLRADFVSSPMVMYLRSQRIRVTSGESLGMVFDPYFNRTYRHFCSHQHSPFCDSPSGFDCGVKRGAITYLAHPVFSLYRTYGAVVYREYIGRVISEILGEEATLEVNLPSMARVALNFQEAENRSVLHLLYATMVNRGGAMTLSGGNVSGANSGIEIIDDLLPLRNIKILLRNQPHLDRVTLEPSGVEIPFQREGTAIRFTVDEFTCHQIIALS